MTILTSTPTATLVSDADHLELMRLTHEFAWRVDHLKAETLTEITTEDAVLRTDPDNPVSGHEAIRAWGAAFDKANPLPGVRHFVSNFRFVDNGDGTADGVSMLAAFYTPEGETPTTVPFAVGEDHDTFRRTPEGWKFTSRLWVPIAMR